MKCLNFKLEGVAYIGLPITLANWQPFSSTSQGSMYMPWLKLF